MQTDDTIKNETVIKKAIMDELGVSDASEEIQDEIVEKIGEIILKKMFVTIMNRLDDVSMENFNRMIEDKRTMEEIEEFLKLKISDYDQLVVSMAQETKDEIKM